MIHELGIMQGRLLPPEGGRIQSFPEKKWRHEFQLARKIGLDRIEWIVDEPNWRENPLMTVEGREEIAELSRVSGVGVGSACADVFMVYPLHSVSTAELKFRFQMLDDIIEAAGKSGLEHIDIPFVDASAITTAEAFDAVVEVFRAAAPTAQRCGVTLCLETSLEPKRFRELLQTIDHPRVKANHDIGNSASLGYRAADEFAEIGPWIFCVHIKDRKRGGTTVPLGAGDADFDATFNEIKKIDYRGHFILQAARGPEEVEWTKKNAAFARKWIGSLPANQGAPI